MMQRQLRTISRIIVMLWLALFVTNAFGQVPQPDADPGSGSLTCETAVPLCKRAIVANNFYGVDDGVEYWFKFYVDDIQVVGLFVDAINTGGYTGAFKLRLYKSQDEQYPCGSLTEVSSHDAYGSTGPYESMYFEQSLTTGTYYLRIVNHNNVNGASYLYNGVTVVKGLHCDDECDNCLPPFAPIGGQWYVINAWVRLSGAALDVTNYSGPKITVEAPTGMPVLTLVPQIIHPIIDGWQLMEDSLQMPLNADNIRITTSCDNCSAYFDDVRFFPADGSMKCYVYDPENLRFVAELDERHFATFYEYDSEGNLVRVKKETERGIKTLKETRQNAPHLEVQ